MIVLPDGPFDVAIIDPAWTFQVRSRKGETRSPQAHYRTLPLAVIKAMPVNAILAKDAVAYIWGTAPMIRFAFEALDAWGLTYVSQFTWDKQKIGLGYWNRNRHEIVLIAKKGKPRAPAPRHRIPSLFAEKAREHSRKPDFLHRHVEAWWPEARKVELFARERRSGWTSWGDQPDHFLPAEPAMNLAEAA